MNRKSCKLYNISLDLTKIQHSEDNASDLLYCIMALDLPKNVGWIGLGLMGFPMATNLLKKMDSETRFYVYDVAQDSLDKFVSLDEAKGRVKACASSREVADKSVRH